MSNALFDPSRIGPGLTLIGVSFWVFLTIVVLVSFWYAFARNREIQATIRLAIEKGMQLDPALIDRLVTRKYGNPEDYLIGGIICLAVGIGLSILGVLLGRVKPDDFFPLVGSGILVGLIGIGLTGCGILISRWEKAGKTGSTGCEPHS
jgi:hypothetical protein